MKAHPFYDKLLEKGANGKETHSFVLVHSDYVTTPPLLTTLLGKEELSDVAKLAVEALETINEESNEWMSFKWRLWAFIEMQDIFDVPIHLDATRNNLFQGLYFYYESLFLLRESICVGLNGFYNSSQNSLRSFLEFNVLQNYHNNIRSKSSSYSPLNEFLKNGYIPRWNKILKKSIGEIEMREAIFERLDMHYRALSNNSSHPYHPRYSPKHLLDNSRSGHSAIGLDSFWRTIDCVLEGVLWLYYSNFPMLFKPADFIKKFGFSPPVGLFIHPDQEHIFRNSLRPKDYNAFKKITDESSDVQGLISWCESLPDITDDEIKASWNKEDGPIPEDSKIAWLLIVSKMRCIKEALASIVENSINDSNFDPDKVDISMEGILELKKKKQKLK